MARLLWKELTYNWWLVLASSAVGAILMLSGDPVYWGDTLSLRAFWLKLPVLMLGLRAYSTELGGETVQFLSSRPIRWWHIWAAKLVAGIAQTMVIAVLLGLVYALLSPAEYRPFMASGVLEGIWKGCWMLSVMYFAGFTASVLMPGVPLSLAAMVVVVIVLSAPAIILAQIARTDPDGQLARFARAMGDNTGLLYFAAAPVGSMFIARGLARLTAGRRWAVCIIVLLSATLCGAVTAGIWGNIQPSKNKPITACVSLSPNAIWAVYSVTNKGQGRTYLIDTSNGKRCVELLDSAQSGHTWSPDSSRLAYWRGNSIRIVSTEPTPRVGPLVRVEAVPGRSARRSRSALSWSPSGDRLAVVWMGRPDEMRYSLAVIRADRDEPVSPRTLEFRGMNAIESASSDVPALVMTDVLYWPARDGGRFTSIQQSFSKER